MPFGSYIRYTSRDALRSIGRHKGMAFASVITIAISLFILGGTLLLVLNTQNLAAAMESQVEINVFMHLDTERQNAQALQNKFAKIPGFSSAEFVTKEEALTMMQDRFGKDSDLTGALGGNNPLPDSYRIKAVSSAKVQALAEEIKQFPEVESVRYGKEIVDKLMSFTTWIRNVGFAVIAGMLIAGLFLITTTIRLTVFARKKEITIMKYVGATNWFIRFPFFLEGMLIGLLGATCAGLVIYFGYDAVVNYIIMSVPFLPVVSDHQILLHILLLLIGGGTVIGALGSVIAVRKYLKV
ncbi:MAG: permease-like cell division protein FtsX [Peptococcaceae bacterium]